MHLMNASKKGMSAHQLWRMLGFGSYRTAWFMCHRIREAMTDKSAAPMGGEGKIVEADETVIGGKERNKRLSKRNPKNIQSLADLGNSFAVSLDFLYQGVGGVQAFMRLGKIANFQRCPQRHFAFEWRQLAQHSS